MIRTQAGIIMPNRRATTTWNGHNMAVYGNVLASHLVPHICFSGSACHKHAKERDMTHVGGTRTTFSTCIKPNGDDWRMLCDMNMSHRSSLFAHSSRRPYDA